LLLDKGWGGSHPHCWLHEGAGEEVLGRSLGVGGGLDGLVFLLQRGALGAPSHGDWLTVG